MEVKKIACSVGFGCLTMIGVACVGFTLGSSAVVGVWATGRELKTMDAVTDAAIESKEDVKKESPKTTWVKIRPKTFADQTDVPVDGTEDKPITYATWNVLKYGAGSAENEDERWK